MSIQNLGGNRLMWVGITTAIQIAVFDTLRSWLLAGELLAPQIVSTPLFTAAFDALVSDELFDSAVDVLCDMIHETQEISDNVGVIQQIVPRLVATRAQMEEHQEDPDRIRGYCRLFSEAGECYKDLIVRHTDELLPLVQAIAACAAYPDLDIVPITFNFWYFLATTLGRQPTDPTLRPILDIYASLQTVIISHLRFPNDNEAQTAQERDEFRTFRHRMGDTLKDCCHVLGAPTCLRKSYDLVVEAMQKPSPSWQEIEAPLFSMRSMGAEVDPDDDEVLPHIMALLPTLPDHPRIRYAAILVISRYTQWIDRHPQNLAFQLEYISSGFNLAQEEVSAAAAQAMKFMCQDCSRHLVPFLPQLHAFIGTVGDKLDQSDLVEVSEAIGYVISGMEAAESVRALQQFAEPLIARVQAVVAMADPQKADLQRAAGEFWPLVSPSYKADRSRRYGATGCSCPNRPYWQIHPRILLPYRLTDLGRTRLPLIPLRQTLLHLRTSRILNTTRPQILSPSSHRPNHPADAGPNDIMFRGDRLSKLPMDNGEARIHLLRTGGDARWRGIGGVAIRRIGERNRDSEGAV